MVSYQLLPEILKYFSIKTSTVCTLQHEERALKEDILGILPRFWFLLYLYLNLFIEMAMRYGIFVQKEENLYIFIEFHHFVAISHLLVAILFCNFVKTILRGEVFECCCQEFG